MLPVPFALSIHHFINSIGADVGFASIIAVALLVLLYFAHARETATLRERLEEAQARIGGLEARLVQLMNAQAGAVQRGRGPFPPPPGVAAAAPPTAAAGQPRPAGAAIPSVRRIPTATAAGAAAPAPAAANGLPPLAPVGVGGPALASATKVIPTAVPAPAPAASVAVPDATMFIPAGANGAAPPPAPPVAAPAPEAVPPRPAASLPRSPSLAPPRVELDSEEDRGRRRRRREPPTRSLLDEDFGGGGRRLSGRLLPILVSAVAVVVIVVALIVITGSSGTPTTAVVQRTTPEQTGASVTNHKKHHAAPFVAANVQVAVLNGTAVAGLAADVAKVLSGDGYKQGNVTNAAVQTQTATVVYYVTGAHTAANETAAQHVAGALSLASASVMPATQAALQSCATGPTGNPLGSCAANVIVSVGTDRTSLASNAG